MPDTVHKCSTDYRLVSETGFFVWELDQGATCDVLVNLTKLVPALSISTTSPNVSKFIIPQQIMKYERDNVCPNTNDTSKREAYVSYD